MIKKKQPEKVWTDKVSEFKGDFKNFVKRKEFIYIQQKAKPSRHLQRGIFDRLKTSFKNIWKKSGLGRILKIYPSW